MNTKTSSASACRGRRPRSSRTNSCAHFIAQGRDRAQVEAEIFSDRRQSAGVLRRCAARAAGARDLSPAFTPRAELAPWRQWGEGLEAEAVKQMANACALPVAVAGALMPDAHVGYGLPIGGVLATDNAVIPYAVGVDIACRMKLTVYDRKAQHHRRPARPPREYPRGRNALRHGLRLQAAPRARRDGRRLDRLARDAATARQGVVAARHERHRQSLRRVRRVHRRMRTTGVARPARPRAGRIPRAALALAVRAARARRCATSTASAPWPATQHLPKELKHLAWLSLDDADGQEYWAAMNLMGRYAAANHALIHKHIAQEARRARDPRHREPPQLRVERNATS